MLLWSKRNWLVLLAAAITLHFVTGKSARGDSSGWIQLPIRWTAVDGSPIAEGSDPTLTLMNRQRGANVLLSQARINLISGLRDRTAFPIISDPDTSVGAPGDVVIGGVGAGREVRQLRRATRRAYDAPLLPRRRRGIFGIAAGRFNDPDGSPTGAPGAGGVIGMGWRYRRMFIVEDPAPRSRPAIADWILVAHETGHVLTLDHTTTPGRVMFPTIGPTNFDFSNGEISDMRHRARRIRGARIDPPGVFDPGPVVGEEVLDLLVGDEHPNPLPEYLDLDAAGTLFDLESNRVGFEQELWGLIPEANLTGPVHYWTLLDVDNSASTGASAPLLGQLGLNTAFNGTDLALLTTVTSDGQSLLTQGSMWEFADNQVFDLLDPSATFSVDRDRLEPVYSEGAIPNPELSTIPISDMIVTQLDNGILRTPFTFGQPYRMQMILQDGQGVISDLLDEQEQGLTFMFAHPETANAFVVDNQNQPIAGRFAVGETVSAIADGLLPGKPFELWVGDRAVAEGITGPDGDVAVQFVVDHNFAPGTYPLSFVNAGTGISADNVLEILAPYSADFNQDGQVDGDDLAMWKNAYGMGRSADADGDGDSDGTDFLSWQRRFGTGSSTNAQAVPEPTSFAVAIAACVAHLVTRRRISRLR